MRVINGVKYRDIFFKFTNKINFLDNVFCFICQEEIKEGSNYYTDLMNSVRYKGSYPYTLRICVVCIKSSIHAETIIIPLIKILYGGIVIVERYSYDDRTIHYFKY